MDNELGLLNDRLLRIAEALEALKRCVHKDSKGTEFFRIGKF